MTRHLREDRETLSKHHWRFWLSGIVCIIFAMTSANQPVPPISIMWICAAATVSFWVVIDLSFRLAQGRDRMWRIGWASIVLFVLCLSATLTRLYDLLF